MIKQVLRRSIGAQRSSCLIGLTEKVICTGRLVPKNYKNITTSNSILMATPDFIMTHKNHMFFFTHL